MSFPIRTTQIRDVDQVPEAQRVLEYRFEPTSGKQPVTRNRLVAQPCIDLNDYRCRAVFDWIEIYVETPASARACDLGKMLNHRLRDDKSGGIFVTGCARTSRYEGQHFVIRIQDPTLGRMEKLLAELRQKFPVWSCLQLSTCEIVGLELAIDFYPKSTRAESDLDLALRRAQISQVLRNHFILDRTWEANHISKDPGWWPRYVDQDKGGSEKLFRQASGYVPKERKGISALKLAAAVSDRHRSAPLNGTVYIGQEGSDIAFRLQDKTGDKRIRDQIPVPIDQSERRARIEVTILKLDWTEVGILRVLDIGSMDELLRTDFSKLQQMLFNFQLPTIGLDQHGVPIQDELDIFGKTGAMGLDLYHRGRREIEIAASRQSDRAPCPNALRAKGLSLKYTQLNRMVSRAMKDTVRRFKMA
jgi:hypothetical protein